jgi:hypothetical protein
MNDVSERFLEVLSGLETSLGGRGVARHCHGNTDEGADVIGPMTWTPALELTDSGGRRYLRKPPGCMTAYLHTIGRRHAIGKPHTIAGPPPAAKLPL